MVGHDVRTAVTGSRIEVVVSVLLVVHGATLLTFGGLSSGPIPLQWALLAAVACIGISALTPRFGSWGAPRAWLLLATTLLLLVVTGGVSSFYTLWLFALVPVYAAVLPSRAAVAYAAVAGCAYLLLQGISTRPLPVAVLIGRPLVFTGAGLVVVYLIAQVRRAERETRDLSMSKDRFVSSVAHELRTPLTTVVGLSATLSADEARSRGEVREFADSIHVEAVAAARVIEDLAVLTRVADGMLALAPEEIDLRALIDTLLDQIGPIVDTGRTRVLSGVAQAFADPVRVGQVLRHLLDNAYRHGVGTVEVALSTDGAHAVVEVRDEGPGLPQEARATLREPFRGRPGHVVGIDRLGLGLPVGVALAELMHGSLEYVAGDGGPRFRLTLPAAGGSGP